MQANELRIGNKLLVYDNIDTIGEVSYNSIICGYTGYSNLDKGYVEPIPLTEEILLKCKGVKSSYTSNPELIGASKKYNLGSIIIFQQNEDESVFYTCINEDRDNLIVDTLHQLQNLYFALTGQELEINL